LSSLTPASDPIDNTRRARIARLREETDPIVAAERRTALRALLRTPLLTPDGEHSGEFALIRRHREWLATWFAHHANWSLSVTAEVARLRKTPAVTTDSSRGAMDARSEELFTRTRYVLLCLALAALERGDRQVTLGRLAEAITSSIAADPGFVTAGFAWSLDNQGGRRDFVHALRFLLALGALRRVQGDEERFVHDKGSDALYNVIRPVLVVLLACRRSPSLVTTMDFESRLDALTEDSGRPDTIESQNRAIRAWLVRRLIDDPVLYYQTLSAENRAYLDRQRGHLIPELTAATGLEAEVRAEGIALADADGDCTDIGLPEEGTEGHLTLLLAAWFAGKLRETRESAPGLTTIEAVRQQTARLIRKHRHHWRKEVTQKGAEIWLTQLVLSRLAGLGLIEYQSAGVIPLPAVGRYALRATQELEEIVESEALDFE